MRTLSRSSFMDSWLYASVRFSSSVSRASISAWTEPAWLLRESTSVLTAPSSWICSVPAGTAVAGEAPNVRRMMAPRMADRARARAKARVNRVAVRVRARSRAGEPKRLLRVWRVAINARTVPLFLSASSYRQQVANTCAIRRGAGTSFSHPPIILGCGRLRRIRTKGGAWRHRWRRPRPRERAQLGEWPCYQAAIACGWGWLRLRGTTRSCASFRVGGAMSMQVSWRSPAGVGLRNAQDS